MHKMLYSGKNCLRRKLWPVVISMLLVFRLGHATIKETAEGVVVGSLASIIRVYRDSNGDTLPTSWEQIKSFYDLELLNQRLVGRESYPIEKHYQFFSPAQLPMPGGGVKGHVLLLRTIPLGDRNEIANAQKLFRYVVYLRGDGEILTLSIPEVEVQKMLKNSGLTVTPEPGLPAVECDTLAATKEENRLLTQKTSNPPDLQNSDVNSSAVAAPQATVKGTLEDYSFWTRPWTFLLFILAAAILVSWLVRRWRS